MIFGKIEHHVVTTAIKSVYLFLFLLSTLNFRFIEIAPHFLHPILASLILIYVINQMVQITKLLEGERLL